MIEFRPYKRLKSFKNEKNNNNIIKPIDILKKGMNTGSLFSN